MLPGKIHSCIAYTKRKIGRQRRKHTMGRPFLSAYCYMARFLELFDRSCVSCTHSWSSNPQVSEELPVCLLPFCHWTGWALLSLPPNASKPSPARAFRLYLWLLRWCLCDFDPSGDRRDCGDHLSVISSWCGVLLACSAILGEPTHRR